MRSWPASGITTRTSRPGRSTSTSAPCAASSESSGSRRSSASVTGTARAPPSKLATMKLRSRFTVLFAVMAAAAVLVLILVSDATVGRAVEDRVAERFRRELEHLANDLGSGAVPEAARDTFLRNAAQQ